MALEQQHKAFLWVHQNWKRAKRKTNELANRHAQDVKFEIGDPVYNNKRAMMALYRSTG